MAHTHQMKPADNWALTSPLYHWLEGTSPPKFCTTQWRNYRYCNCCMSTLHSFQNYLHYHCWAFRYRLIPHRSSVWTKHPLIKRNKKKKLKKQNRNLVFERRPYRPLSHLIGNNCSYLPAVNSNTALLCLKATTAAFYAQQNSRDHTSPLPKTQALGFYRGILLQMEQSDRGAGKACFLSLNSPY